MPYRITLVQNLPNRAPAAFEVTYTFSDGRPPATWPLHNVHPDRDAAVVTADCGTNLINQQNVLTRTLISHYPTAPNTVQTQISSVQLGLAARSNVEEMQPMATDYAINIHMSDDTVDKLQNGGYQLYGFKGVQSTIKGGAPLVWFQTLNYSGDTNINWQEQYQAYTTTSESIASGRVTATRAYDADLGQVLEVTGQGGTGSVVYGGTPGAISILNKTEPRKPFDCGISQVQSIGGKPVAMPLCAFPLYGNGLDVMAPIQKVLLMFSTLEVNTGTVIYKAYSEGILIDLTGVTSRDVEFDINAGWSWGGGAWAKRVQANADVVPMLIVSNAALSQRVLQTLNAAPEAREQSSREHASPREHAENGHGTSHRAVLEA